MALAVGHAGKIGVRMAVARVRRKSSA